LSERHLSTTAETTEAVGRAIAARLHDGDLVLLKGDLAAGKTTLVRGLAEGLGADPDEVSSPSYVLVQPYPCRHPEIATLYHVDLYRLEDDVATLRSVGLEDLMSEPHTVVAVEWPVDTVLAWRPLQARQWIVQLTAAADDTREITIEPPEVT
jgi:tRNA threonylcarbamoyladenosine biosynthesis protein TsaE